MRTILRVGVALAVAAAVPAFAGEERFRLKEGEGVDKVRATCVACHSLDYIELNSHFLDKKGWEAVVTKMNKAFGAPVKPEDAEPIAAYLAKYYGKS